MRFAKSVQLALNMLLHSKLRSWLTIIGIVIGVAAVVAIISIGQGMQQNVASRLGGLGADIITVSPGGGRATSGFRGPEGGFGENQVTSTSKKNLTSKDIQVIRSVAGVKYVMGTVSGRAELYYLAEKTTTSIQGVDAQVWKDITTSTLESGRLLGPSDYNAVVVGSRIATGTFKQPLAINQMITIGGKPFKIVGILKASGSDDRAVIMSIDAARDLLNETGSTRLDSITIKVESADLVDQVTNETDTKLAISRHVSGKKKDYSITSAKAAQESISATLSTITLFLGAIAAVSLVVGAVGVANTMFTSVLEKTKEIGIMKSIGAKNRDILVIFILNAAMVGMVGGLLGIALGAALSSLLPSFGLRLMGGGAGGTMTTAITPQLLIGALLLSIAIGVVAGAIPAYRASKLRPVDALRYE